jgi:hypothetical protein
MRRDYPAAPELTEQGHVPARTGNRTVLGRMNDDAGAIAILVALSISTFLLAFAALAVDLGQVYTRNGELQSVADAAALAGATELPDVTDARRKALDTLCADSNRLAEWEEDGICPTADAAGLPAWVTNTDPDDGQIVLYRTFNTVTGRLDPGSVVTSETQEAVGIRVKLPPSTVEFGLARSFGADNVSVSKAASARIGTPEGLGVLPFAVTGNDARQVPTRNNRFCIVDQLAGEGPGGAPQPTLPLHRITLDRLQVDTPTTGEQIRITPRSPTTAFPARTPRVFVDEEPQTVLPTPSTTAITVRLDTDLEPGTHTLWVTWPGRFRTEVSSSATFTVGDTAELPGASDVCDRFDATRGVLEVARELPAGAAELNPHLAENVKQGLFPSPRRYDRFPALLPPIGDALQGLRCLGAELGLPLVPGLVAAVRSILAGGDAEIVNCVNTRDAGFSDGITEGLIGGDGRLTHRCSDEGTLDMPNGTRIDNTGLFDPGNGLVNTQALEGQTLKDLIADNNVARGALLGDIFACGRLGLVPVIDPVDDRGGGVGNGVYPIARFTYVWIGDPDGDTDGSAADDGLHFNGGRLRAVEFTIIDPAFFGRTVSGSPKVGPWLGPGLPREILLVKDQDDDA